MISTESADGILTHYPSSQSPVYHTLGSASGANQFQVQVQQSPQRQPGFTKNLQAQATGEMQQQQEGMLFSYTECLPVSSSFDLVRRRMT
jgi:hypothetical protein